MNNETLTQYNQELLELNKKYGVTLEVRHSMVVTPIPVEPKKKSLLKKIFKK